MPASSSKPLVNKPIVTFLITSLHGMNFTIDKRYCLCLCFLLTVLHTDKEKENLWETLRNYKPNLDGELISVPLELPYFGYMVGTPNPRQILKKKVATEGAEKQEDKLFIYDPRAKKSVNLNWCAESSEEIIVYMYNPLPFSVTIDSLEIQVKNSKVFSHSGKFIMKPFESKKRVSVLLKFMEPGEVEITGILVTCRQLSYSLASLPSGVSMLAKENPELPVNVGI
jgi:hypothetical protein